MNADLKKIINNCVDMALSVLEAAKVDLGSDPKGAIKFEMAAFAMLITGADSTIVYEEAKTVGDYFDLNLTPNTVGKVLEDMNIMSKEFLETPPLALKALVVGDNAVFESGKKFDPWGSELLFKTYKAIAAEMIQADGKVVDDELTVANIYLNMMANYIKDNLKVGYVPS